MPKRHDLTKHHEAHSRQQCMMMELQAEGVMVALMVEETVKVMAVEKVTTTVVEKAG